MIKSQYSGKTIVLKLFLALLLLGLSSPIAADVQNEDTEDTNQTKKDTTQDESKKDSSITKENQDSQDVEKKEPEQLEGPFFDEAPEAKNEKETAQTQDDAPHTQDDYSHNIEDEAEADFMLDEDSLFGASLEELLAKPIEFWSATRTAQTVETAPSIVAVITAADMHRWGYRTLAEALEHVLGFYIIDDHIIPNIAIRGISGGLGSESGLLKLMVNSRPVSFKSTAGNWTGLELIPFTAIDRIEIIRGPASALYGADAFLATINVILKKPEDFNGGQVRGTVGSQTGALKNLDSIWALDNSYDVSGGGKIGNFGFFLAIAGQQSTRSGMLLPLTSPSPVIPDYQNGRQLEGLVNNSNVIYTQFSLDRPKGSIALTGHVSSIERGGDLSRWSQLSYGTDDLGRHNETKVHLQQAMISLDGEYNPSEDVSLFLRLSGFRGRPLANDRIEVASNLYYIERDFSYNGVDLSSQIQWSPLKELTIVGGLDLVFDYEQLPTYSRIRKDTNEQIGLDIESIDSEYKSLINPGAYLQGHYDLVEDFIKVTGGIRYDHHNIYGGSVTGRAGGVFLWTKDFSTKILYGSAFKAPSPQLLYSEPIMPGDIVGNENLEPQYVHTFEISPSLRFAKYFRIQTTGAYSQIIDKAEFVPSGINVFADNVSKVHSLSWETLLDFAYRDLILSYASFELVQAKREAGQEGYRNELIGEKNIIYPPWIFRAGASLGLPFSDRVPAFISSGLRLVAKRRASGENIVENGSDYYLPLYAMWDAYFSTGELDLLPVGKSIFSVKAYNLLDVIGPDPGFAGIDYPLLSRRIMLEFIQTF